MKNHTTPDETGFIPVGTAAGTIIQTAKKKRGKPSNDGGFVPVGIIAATLIENIDNGECAEAEKLFRKSIILLLEDGFGSEDISIYTGYAHNDIKYEIKAMRREGVLAGLFQAHA